MKRFLLVAFIINLAWQTSAQTYPLVSIHDLQFVPEQSLQSNVDASLQLGDTVQVEGIVTFNPCTYGLSTTGSRVGTWLQDSAGNEWSGVHVLIDPGALSLGITVDDLNQAVLFQDNFVVGNRVKATGVVSEFQQNTQILLLPIQSEITCLSCVVPPPVNVTIDLFELNDGSGNQIQQKVTGEKFEGMYVELTDVQIVDASLGTGSNTGRVFWTVQDAQGNRIQIRDVSGHFRNDTTDTFCIPTGYTPVPFPLPQVNITLSYLRGIIVDALLSGTQQYTIAPLSLTDVGPQTFASPVVSNVVESIPVPTTSQAQTIIAKIVDADGTISSATLYYSIGLGSSSFNPVTMTPGANNNWSGVIPATGPDSTYVIYYISATDNDGHVTNYPNTTGFGSYYLILNSGINAISDVQYNPLGLNDSPYKNTLLSGVNIEGIAMSTTGDLGVVVLQDGSDAWSGITITTNANIVSGPSLPSLQRGDKVQITSARVFESNTVTMLDTLTYTLLSPANPLPAPVLDLNMDSVSLGVYGYTEPYESMLLQYDTVYVTSNNPDDPADFGEWAIYYSVFPVNELRVDDYSYDIGPEFNADSLTLYQQLDYIRGILTRSFGNWKLLPRDRNDIAGFAVGIHSVSDFYAFDIFPNPVSNDLHVRLTGNVGHQVDWVMMDVTGRVINRSVLDSNVKDYVVPVENLSDGMYIIRVSTSQGSQTARFVKQ